MRDLRLVAQQTCWALLIVLRVRETVVFTLAFPIVLLVFYNSIFAGSGDATIKLSSGVELASEAYFTAAMVAYAITFSAFSTLAISLVSQRETGQLKRLRGTPLPPVIFVVAQILRVAVLGSAITLALLTIGVVVFGVALDVEAAARIALYALAGIMTMASLGVALSAAARSPDTASSAAPFIAVILSFISGVFLPLELLPGWLEAVGTAFPLAHLADGLQRALADDGGGLDPVNLLVLGAWAAVGLVVATRHFRWEPQQGLTSA
jgi:ABC-2 type transport system permease protein